MTYVSVTEAAKKIRAELKAIGINSRKVSVRSDSFSMGSSINVEIKDPAIKLAVVEEIANKAQRIDRCEYSGEILGGCNRYAHVRYSFDATDAMAEPWKAAAEKAMAQMEEWEQEGELNKCVTVEGAPQVYVFRQGHQLMVSHEDYCQPSYVGSAQGLAQRIGYLVLNKEVA